MSPVRPNAPELATRLQELTRFQGKYQLLLDEVAVPVFIVGDASPDPPRRLAHGGTALSGVLTEPNIQLLNPLASGFLVRLLGIYVAVDAVAGTIFLSHQDTALATNLPTNIAFMDRRLDAQAPAAELRQEDVAAGGTKIERFAVPASPSFQGIFLDEDIILNPGRGITMNHNGANDMVVSYQWEEIPLSAQNL